MNQYALLQKGHMIHSSAQLEAYENDVNDCSIKTGGQQCITTNDGYIFPINIKDGIPYMEMRKFTDDEFESLPHIIWTSDTKWDPRQLDHNITDD